ncbi:MAG: hypothetical protein AAF633_20600 [Chloroflexota bacterium]
MQDVDESTAIALRTLLITAIGTSISVWDIAFWLGVHGTIFYNKIFVLWVSSIAVLLVALFVPKGDRFTTKWGILALTMPTIWFVINALIPVVTQSWIDLLVWFLALAAFVLTIPFILYILFQLVESDAWDLSPAYRNRLIAIVAIVAILGYLVGSNHTYFVSCEQFNVAGDFSPANCESWSDEF